MNFPESDLTIQKPFSDGTIASIVLAAMIKARLGWNSNPDVEKAKDIITASDKMMRVFGGCCEAIDGELKKPTVDANKIARLILTACSYAFNHPVKELTAESLAQGIIDYAGSIENRKAVTALAVLLTTWHERKTMTVGELISLSDEIRSSLACL